MAKVVMMMCLAAAATLPLAAAVCDAEIQCEYQTEDTLHGNRKVYWDFHALCKTSGDYVLHDNAGHDYYAQICGVTETSCLPKSWTNTYQRGVAIQNWGAQPTCDHENPTGCTNKEDNSPACCTKDCQVLGTGLPQYSLESTDPSKVLTGGVRVAFKGAPPTADDPFWCPWNPATAAQYEREVHYVFACDVDATGYAQPVIALQNKTDDCKYELHFNSALACGSYVKPGSGSGSGSGSGNVNPNHHGSGSGGSNKIGGGWVFIIILLVCGSVYVVAGTLLVYSRERVWRFPNTEFWGYVGGLVTDGVKFVASGFKSQGGSAAGGVVAGSAYDDLGAGSSGAAGGAAAGGTAYGASAYQADTTPADAPKTTAYTDL